MNSHLSRALALVSASLIALGVYYEHMLTRPDLCRNLKLRRVTEFFHVTELRSLQTSLHSLAEGAAPQDVLDYVPQSRGAV